MLKKIQIITAFFFVFLLISGGSYSSVPDGAYRFRHELAREVRLAHGLSGPISLHAALIHQESRWKTDAVSPAGARGLAQFMPATADWMTEITGGLDSTGPLNASWSIRAMSVYTAWILERVLPLAGSKCDAWAFVLSSYNGGLTWLKRDMAIAYSSGLDPGRWWDSVELESNRADWAKKENRGYVNLIILKWQPIYLRSGWPGPEVCDGWNDI